MKKREELILIRGKKNGTERIGNTSSGESDSTPLKIPLSRKMLIKSNYYLIHPKKYKAPNSLKFQGAPIEEFSQTFDYGLKDITKLYNFNQVVDWETS